MSKSKFDMSLLKPVDSPNADFQSQLKPVENGDEGEYLENLPQEPSFLAKLPRNMLIGLANLGHSVLNTPKQLTQSLEQALLPLQQGLESTFAGNLYRSMPHIAPLSEKIPFQQEQDFAGMLGQKGEPSLMDSLVQKGVEYSPEILSGRALIKAGMRRLPITQRGAARKLKSADAIMEELGGVAPIDPELAEKALPFLPKTYATREMMEGVKAGKYKPTFSLQSQIGTHERALAKSPLPADRLLAPEARELKSTILKGMEQVLRDQAHLDPRYAEAADLLKGGIDDYRKYIKFRDTAMPLLKKAGIPTGILGMLGLGYKTAKQVSKNLVD